MGETFSLAGGTSNSFRSFETTPSIHVLIFFGQKGRKFSHFPTPAPSASRRLRRRRPPDVLRIFCSTSRGLLEAGMAVGTLSLQSAMCIPLDSPRFDK